MEVAAAQAFARERERLSFRWAAGSIVGAILSGLVLVAAWMCTEDWEEPGTSIVAGAFAALLLCAAGSVIFLAAWAVWRMRRRRFNGEDAAPMK
ncbi:MAG TPA: hypothetical protein VIM46_01220 [Luteolibacter sp.]